MAEKENRSPEKIISKQKRLLKSIEEILKIEKKGFILSLERRHEVLRRAINSY